MSGTLEQLACVRETLAQSERARNPGGVHGRHRRAAGADGRNVSDGGEAPRFVGNGCFSAGENVHACLLETVT
eukprot:359486-Chlamydomonas_euryale.AAC.3